jgi:hypothetical protein
MDFVAEPLREPGKPAFGSGWFSSNAIGKPTRRRPAGCCARTVSGHAVSRSAIALMKSRRRIASPEACRCAGDAFR